MQTKKHILIGTSVFNKYLRQDLCVQSLHKLKNKNSNVDVCLIQQPADHILYNDINIIEKLTRNSSNVFNTTKTIPFVNDIFNIMSDESKDVFVYCNSDIILTQKLIDHINNIDVEAFGISRIDISNIETLKDPAKIIRMEPSGFDCWVISKNWWALHKHLFQDFVIGRPYFDVMYTILMLINSSNLYISTDHLIYHVMHDRAWADKDDCYHFNRLQKEKYYEPLESIWGECCNNTFLKRSDWGSFLNFRPDEQKIIADIQKNNKK